MKKLNLNPDILESLKVSYDYISSFRDSIDRLAKDLQNCELEIEQRIKDGSPANKEQAKAVVKKAWKLLGQARVNPAHENLPLWLAAVDYVVSEMDAIPDFESRDGFSDDEQVLDAVSAPEFL